MEDLQKKQGGEQKEKDNTVEMILFSSLAIVALLLAELYLLVVTPGFLVAIAVVAVLILGCSYLDLAACGRRMRTKDAFREEQHEQYANILKSEKASFLLIRKYCDEIELQISLLEERFADPIQEVVVAQKATAKVTINRNKENAYALMNSNDRMQEKIASIESRIEKLASSLSGNAAGGGDYSVDLTPIQNQLSELEERLKAQMFQVMNQIPKESDQAIPEPALKEEEILPEQEAIAEAEPEIISEDGTIDDLETLPEDEPINDVGTFSQDEPVDDLEILPEADSADDPEIPSEAEPMDELEILPETEAEDELESLSEIEPEPVVSDTPAMPDISDPNRAMSPDEIAALFANLE